MDLNSIRILTYIDQCITCAYGMKEKEQLNSQFQGSFHITLLQTNVNEDVVISITKGLL